jgi:hypothetical protein
MIREFLGRRGRAMKKIIMNAIKKGESKTDACEMDRICPLL